MRYSKDHKRISRAAIIRTAAQWFRRHGYDAVSIDTLMSAAGLTRGGFYGHFRSKADLYTAVLADEHDFVQRLRARCGETISELGDEGVEVARGYLHPDHRKGVIKGCALASLAMDTARATNGAQKAYAGVVRKISEEFGRGFDDFKPLDDRTLSALATCIGGLLLSSATAADSELSQAISLAASKQVSSTLSVGSGV